MEAYSLLRPSPQRTMADMHMDLHMQTPQQSLLPQSTPLAPGRRFLPESSHEESRKMKRGDENEEKKGEDEDGELLFDIDEFLVEEEEALFQGKDSSDGDETEGATIIAASPTNTNQASNLSTMCVNESHAHIDGPIPDVASTNTSIVNIPRTSTNMDKKKRKRKKSKQEKTDAFAPPKRPLSAYNLYFREERKRCIAEASSNPSKKYNFEELGKLIGKGWRSLPVKEKRELEARAEADRERYRNEMIAYRNEKRRRAREEDQDSLILMQRQHRHGQITPCPLSPHSQVRLAGSFSPERPGGPYPYQGYVAVSPAHRDYQQDQRYPPQGKPQHYPPNVESNKSNHIRKVSVIASSSPHARNNPDYHVVKYASPSVSSCSCSSWSGDEDDSDRKRKRKHENKNKHERSKGRETPSSTSQAQGNTSNTLPNEAIVVERCPPTPSNDPRYNLHNPPVPEKSSRISPPPPTSSQGVPVARVVAMPATDGLQRILQDGRSPTPVVHNKQHQQQPPSPHAWWAPHAPTSQHHFYPPPAPSLVVSAGERHPYPSPPQSMFLVAPPQHFVSSSSSPPPQPQAPAPAPQMLPLGMNILLRDPATGGERSYRIQYTPKVMTAQQATEYQLSHGGGIVVDDKE